MYFFNFISCRKGRTAGYISLDYFKLENCLFEHFVYFFKFSVPTFFLGETCWKKVFKLKNNRLNNRDFNIDQNNRDYDFSHNQAALPSAGLHFCLYITAAPVTSSLSVPYKCMVLHSTELLLDCGLRFLGIDTDFGWHIMYTSLT